MYKEKWKNYYFPTKPLPDFDKWTLIRKVGQDSLSLLAQLRLEWIISYHTVFDENVTLTAAHFGISRKTFHKWLSRFEERNLKSLEEQSRAPKTKRDWMVTLKEEVLSFKGISKEPAKPWVFYRYIPDLIPPRTTLP